MPKRWPILLALLAALPWSSFAAGPGETAPKLVSVPVSESGPATLPPAVAAPPSLSAAVPETGLFAPEAQTPQAAVSAEVQGLRTQTVQAVEQTAQAPSEDGAAAAARSFDALTWERPRFSPEELETVARTNAALSEAVTRAAGRLLAHGSYEVQQRGSTARLTHTSTTPDYDLTVFLKDAGRYADLDHFVHSNWRRIEHELQQDVQNRAQTLFPGQAVHVSVRGPASIYNSIGHEDESGVALFSVKVRGADERVLIDADVIFTDRPDFANAYPQYFARQMEQVRVLGGESAVEQVLGDIRLVKKTFAQALGAAKTYKGGIGGVGAEQLLMQSGRVSDADKGQTIEEIGSFGKLMRRIVAAAHDSTGRPRRMKEVRGFWKVHNPFMEPTNFLTYIREDKWDRLVKFAKNYLAVESDGRPSTLDRVATGRFDKSPTHSLGRETLALLDRFSTGGPKAVERGDAYLYAEGAKAVPAEYTQAWSRWLDGKPVTNRPELFVRKGTRAYIRQEISDPQKGTTRFVEKEVPFDLAQGLPNQAVVEVVYARKDGAPLSLKPLGSYPVDMIVGRIVRGERGLRLESLFSQDGRPLGVYLPMPLDRGIEVKEGEIVQAYVRPQNGGFVGTPLIGLGREITPEIASREIALRHGARGYFDADVIKQAEEIARTYDAAKEFEQLKAAGLKVEDRTSEPFVTIDPPGAADLDDAFYVRKEADGGYTWYLATALVAPYVKPGTPEFRAAARLGNTFYTIDKEGVGAYPMNHPVISKYVASLLKGKKSLAMITEMRFGPDGAYVPEKSKQSIDLIDVKGRYTYNQVAALWKGAADSGIEHTEQIALARELAQKLNARDAQRGKLKITLAESETRRAADGTWELATKEHDPIEEEAHRLIEELKVYGNLGLKARLMALKKLGVEHFNRTHPPKPEFINARLQAELAQIGIHWDSEKESLSDLLRRIDAMDHLSQEQKEVAQFAVLRTRSRARYTVAGDEGHEGLAFEKGEYGHPSTPIRRFGDMIHNDLLFADLTGQDVKKENAAILSDLKAMGFGSLAEYSRHLNARQDAASAMTRSIDDFMSLYELAKPKHQGQAMEGYVKAAFGRPGNGSREILIGLKGTSAELKIRGDRADAFEIFDQVQVSVRGVDLARLSINADVKLVSRPYPKPRRDEQQRGRRGGRDNGGSSSGEAVRQDSRSYSFPKRDDGRRGRRRGKRRR